MTRLNAFKSLSHKIEEMPEFGAWLQQGTPEQCVPRMWEEEKPLTPIGTAMYQLLVIQVYKNMYLFFAMYFRVDYYLVGKKTKITSSVPVIMFWMR